MAHNITKQDKQQGIKVAWHGLTEVLTPDELQLYVLENGVMVPNPKVWLNQWDIKQVPCFIHIEEEEVRNGWYSFVATDKPRLIIGRPIADSYGVINNAQFVGMVNDTLKGTAHKVVSVGSVRNRGRIFITVQLNEDSVKKLGNRTFEDYLTFGSSHDMSSELFILNCSFCTVCDNTFSASLFATRSQQSDVKGDEIQGQDAVALRLRHSKHAARKLPEIAKLLDKTLGVRAEFYAALEQLGNEKCDESRAERIFAGFELRGESLSTRAKNRVTRQTELFKSGRGNSGENLLDAFSAATDYYTHESSTSKTDDDSKLRQFESSEFGTGAERKREFFTLLTETEVGGDGTTVRPRLAKAEAIGERALRAPVTADASN
jgi:hypothetical protein